MIFSEVTNPGADIGGESPAIAAQQSGLAAGGRQKAEEHAYGGAFAGAISAEEGKHAAAWHLEVEVAHGRQGSKISGQATSLYYEIIHRWLL
jgi:hypothetical protein